MIDSTCMHYLLQQQLTSLAVDENTPPQHPEVWQQLLTILNTTYTEMSNMMVYRSLFEQTNDAVFILDLDGVHMTVNHRACEMLGYTLDEIRRLSYIDIIDPQYHQNSAYVRQALLNGQKLAPYERVMVRKDGTRVHVEVNVELVRDDQQQPLYIQSVARDITLRKQQEEEASKLHTEKRVVDALRRSINDISHDLRTPLSIMNTSLHLLRRKLERRARTETEIPELPHVDVLEAQVKGLSRITEEVLEMAQLDEATIRFNKEFSRLDSLVQDIVNAHEQTAQQKRQVISLRFEQNLPLVSIDRWWLARAVTHVLINAIEHTPEGTPIYVVVSSKAPYLVIDIIDEGEGIPLEHQPYIFERFYRVDGARHEGRAGLGLPMTRKIIEAHQGKVELQSQPGQGSRFRLLLPTQEVLTQ